MKSLKLLRNRSFERNLDIFVRSLSTSQINYDNLKCKILVVGGGSGGTAVAAKLSNKLGENQVVVLEPSDRHYYQPMFTLIGGGIKNLDDSWKTTKSVLPGLAKWVQDEALKFDPDNNKVTTKKGDTIQYDYLVIAMGLVLNYDKIPGLVEALSVPNGPVCSNYSPKYVERTLTALQNFQGGNAICTFPNSPVKCPGAPQKILYLAEHYFRKNKKRSKANMIYSTTLPNIFGVKHYADALWEIAKKRNIDVKLRTNLIEILPCGRKAVFQNLDTNDKITLDFDFLHVTPPQSTPPVLSSHKSLVNEAGFLELNKDTLQHVRYGNIFGIGDCSSTPNSKTAAACAAQSKVLYDNLCAFMNKQKLPGKYDGYASCPIVTGYSTTMLAEFDYDLKPKETFPFPQNKERWTMHIAKVNFMAPLYWYLYCNGLWNGPAFIRNFFQFFK